MFKEPVISKLLPVPYAAEGGNKRRWFVLFKTHWDISFTFQKQTSVPREIEKDLHKKIEIWVLEVGGERKEGSQREGKAKEMGASRRQEAEFGGHSLEHVPDRAGRLATNCLDNFSEL